MPSRAAAYATPCAWLPADEQMTPLRCSIGVSCGSLLLGPRTLYDPVRWNISALSQTSKPVSTESSVEWSSGVRCTSGATRR